MADRLLRAKDVLALLPFTGHDTMRRLREDPDFPRGTPFLWSGGVPVWPESKVLEYIARKVKGEMK